MANDIVASHAPFTRCWERLGSELNSLSSILQTYSSSCENDTVSEVRLTSVFTIKLRRQIPSLPLRKIPRSSGRSAHLRSWARARVRGVQGYAPAFARPLARTLLPKHA